MKNTSLLPILVAAAVPVAALADTHYAGFTKLSVDGLPGELTWADMERRVEDFPGACDTMNDQYTSSIACSYDRKAFQAFYASELKRAKVADRVNSNPGWICGMDALNFLIGGKNATSNVTLMGTYCAQDDACRKQFVASVKSVSCTIASKEGPPSVTLDHGVLRFVMTRNANGDVADADAVLHVAALKLFPRYKTLYDANH